MLKVDSLWVFYGKIPVLKSVTFEIAPGNFVAVCGVNGAGKTTLLKAIQRIIKPSKGAVYIDDIDVGSLGRQALARYMAWIPQNPSITHLSVFETVLLGRLPYNSWKPSDNDFKIAAHYIKELGLADLAHRPIGTLSGGEAQKAAIARALVQNPRVLLCDEPTSHLDLRNQLEIMNTIKSYVESKGIMAIIAIHDLNLALRFCDRLLFLKDGSIYASVGPGEVSTDIIEQVYGINASLIRSSSGEFFQVIPEWRS